MPARQQQLAALTAQFAALATSQVRTLKGPAEWLLWVRSVRWFLLVAVVGWLVLYPGCGWVCCWGAAGVGAGA